MTSSLTIAYGVFDHRRAGGPAQYMLLLIEEQLFADQGTVFLHIAHVKGWAREFKLDFLKALLRSDKAQVHLAVGEQCLQITEAKKTNRHIGTCLLNFIGGDHSLIHKPEHINLADQPLEGRIGEDGK